MSYIVVGGGSAQALLEVKEVPKDGDVLSITEEMIIAGKTENCLLLAGERFRLKKEVMMAKVKGHGELPWFGAINIKYENQSVPDSV